ncbi:hypothetical protein CQW23_28402 [Capsicum baccatum]|uniref:Uncharacterized protein ycf68 n=1 Tax=Capsicum baccatum TaxID=33114 RepID=A0A2G2VGF0_CAPBA|nr:hypothetical protein CQW23_28402 [Capsicum baccatum]
MPRILLKERGAFGNADTGGAWLSSARATAGDMPEEGEDDVKSSCPLCPGRHTCYNGLDKGSRSREGELTPKTRPQFELQAATRLHEAGIASNRRRVNSPIIIRRTLVRKRTYCLSVKVKAKVRRSADGPSDRPSHIGQDEATLPERDSPSFYPSHFGQKKVVTALVATGRTMVCCRLDGPSDCPSHPGGFDNS